MSNQTRKLPLSPHPDHLRKEAKARLAEMKTRLPTARLADAQLVLAREYGFAGWGHLMADVMKRGQGPRSRTASLMRWRLRSRFEPDDEQEAHATVFRVSAAAHVGFIIAALTGVAIVVVYGGHLSLAALLHKYL